MRSRVAELLEKVENVIIDRGGTKAMTSALTILGTIFEVNTLSYITGKRKGGIVQTGTEEIRIIQPYFATTEQKAFSHSLVYFQIMKVELDPTSFGRFYKSLEKAVALEKLLGSGWQREIKRHRHALYNDGCESYDWTIVYSNPSTRIDLSITELYIDADFVHHTKKREVTMPERLERLSKNAAFWRVPLLYVVNITIEGKNADQIQREVNKLLQAGKSRNNR